MKTTCGLTTAFVDSLKQNGVNFLVGVPCSSLGGVIQAALEDDALDYVGATNEAGAVALASGAALGGALAGVLLQNSGLGNAVNPLTSLNLVFEIPVLLLVSWRGEAKDEPQHAIMGNITPGLLDLLGIRWSTLPANPAEIDAVLGKAVSYMTEKRQPYAIVVPCDRLERGTSYPVDRAPAPTTTVPPRSSGSEVPTRTDVLRAIREAAQPTDVLVATTGYTGRELFALGDTPNQLYMVGSMGCALSLGQGIAHARPNHRVIVIDGDGAALMHMGAMATAGYERPGNLLHVLLDNGVHESTGGQPTVSVSTDLAAVAAACGYPVINRASTPSEVGAWLADAESGLRFLHVETAAGAPDALPRPDMTPTEVAARLRNWLGAGA